MRACFTVLIPDTARNVPSFSPKLEASILPTTLSTREESKLWPIPREKRHIYRSIYPYIYIYIYLPGQRRWKVIPTSAEARLHSLLRVTRVWLAGWLAGVQRQSSAARARNVFHEYRMRRGVNSITASGRAWRVHQTSPRFSLLLINRCSFHLAPRRHARARNTSPKWKVFASRRITKRSRLRRCSRNPEGLIPPFSLSLSLSLSLSQSGCFCSFPPHSSFRRFFPFRFAVFPRLLVYPLVPPARVSDFSFSWQLFLSTRFPRRFAEFQCRAIFSFFFFSLSLFVFLRNLIRFFAEPRVPEIHES